MSTRALIHFGSSVILLLMSAGCGVERVEQAATKPEQQPEPAQPPQTFQQKSEDTIIVHYHRFDEAYDDVRLWTWDAHEKQTPEDNELLPIGQDQYGLVFEIERRKYGNSDRIGLLPKVGEGWERKDGPDKFWTPDLGNEIYLIGTKHHVFHEPPDLSPQVVGAFIDKPNRIGVQLNRLVAPPEIPPSKIKVTDDAGNAVEVVESNLVTSHPGEERAFDIEITTAQAVDFSNRTYSISVEGYGGSAELIPRGLLDDPDYFYAPDAVLGATYTRASTTFGLFAPTATEVNVIIYDEAAGNKGRSVHPTKSVGRGVWEGSVSGDLEGKYYVYSLAGFDLTPTTEVLDPYAINAVNSSSRGRITDLAATNPPGWERLKNGPAVQSPVDILVYEMHVRDFTIAENSGVKNKGVYLGFAEAGTRMPGDPAITTGLDHLSEIGATHVQLMPVQDFANDEKQRAYNWGYITTAFNTPEGMFASNINDDSRIRELKQLIATLHSRGIGVILDVVYNHTSESAPFNFIVPKYYYRTNPDGTFTNGSGVGNDFRTEAPMARKFIIDSLKYWVTEYGVDGFRFDLMALMDLETMKQAEKELRAINPNIVLYGEPWAAAESPVPVPTNKETISGTTIGAFNDDFRNALKGSPDGDAPGFIQTGEEREAVQQWIGCEGWPDAPQQSINYMTCHDNLVLYDKLQISMNGADEEQIQRAMKLGYLALFTAQGVPFIHGGEEFARSKDGNHNSYDAPDSVNQVDWALKRKNSDLYEYTRRLIALRKAHPIFRLRSRDEIAKRLRFEDTDEGVIIFTLDGTGIPGEQWRRVCVVLNANDETEVTLPGGPWLIGYDERGEAPLRHTMAKTKVPAKTGLVFYQR